MVRIVPEWADEDWFEHGFGTRHTSGWTHRPGRTWVHQTHSTRVLRAHSPGPLGDGDAIATDVPGLLLEIRTADCLPILLIDRSRRAVAAVHAGWRGSAEGIVVETVEAMGRWFGSCPKDLEAAIGPGIGVCCFEVGAEVAERFGRVGRTFVDLIDHNQRLFSSLGLSRVIFSTACTKCHSAEFHSFRRDREAAGRMETGIEIRGSAGGKNKTVRESPAP